MKRTPLRIEPISTCLERYRKGPNFKGSVHPVVVAGELVYVSGLPPFDPGTGEIKRVPFPHQAELVLEQLRLCLETAGSSLKKVLKCNVYCTPTPRISPSSTRSTIGIFRMTRQRGFSCMCRPGPGRSTWRSTAWRAFSAWQLRYKCRKQVAAKAAE